MKNDRGVIDRRNVPFIMVTRAVYEDETLKAADKALYSALCMFADNETADCYPSRDTLIRTAGISDYSFRKSIKTLQEKGYIAVKSRYGNNGQLSNLYILLDVG